MLKNDGSMWTAGVNTFGQLGIDRRKYMMMTNFVQIFPGGVKVVSAGGEHSMALKQDGSMWSAGRNMYGQLGDGTNTNRDSFVKVISIYIFNPLCST